PRDPNLLQLGVSGERIDPDALEAYNETDPRINNVIPFPWIRVNLVDVQGPGYFSVWQTDSFGNPTVWVATAGNPNPDLFFTAPGGHVDYNWAFTAPGDYYVDFQASAFLPDGTPIQSRVTRYHFQVDDTPEAPAPGSFTTDVVAFSQVGTHTANVANPLSALPDGAGDGQRGTALLAGPVDLVFSSTAANQTASPSTFALHPQRGAGDLTGDVLAASEWSADLAGTLR